MDDLVVGLEDEAKKVIGLLTEGPEELDVISIFGMLGLGKTTLAKKIFNDAKIEYHFFVRAFVEVSQKFDKKKVFLNIISAFEDVRDEMRSWSADNLAKYINKYLQKRKYLIVLDDVWGTDVWEALKPAFPKNEKCCRVLITTRNEFVAESAKKRTNPHKLRFLNKDESRLLLRLKVFEEDFCEEDLLEHEKNILKRCNGLPLAIVVIAGILRNHRNESYWWQQVAAGVEDYDPDFKEKIDYVIGLSFDVLPDYLKPCFLYLGVFPEDSEIPARTLLRLWISEGFIQPPRKGNLTLEGVADVYLRMLVDRSLVMVQKRRSNGQVKTIKIHDTLRDFCKEGGEKEHLYYELWRERTAASANIRRLSVNLDMESYICSNPSGEHVRSFLCFAKGNFVLARDKVSIITKGFQLLRVLEIRTIKLAVFPPELHCLILLKYIAFSSDFKALPEKTSNLLNLETLLVQTTARNFEIKADISKMPQLRHLEITSSSSFSKQTENEYSKNQNLQTLSTISPESCTEELFERTPNLKKLGIRGALDQYFKAGKENKLFGTLSKLPLLENLKLLNDTTSITSKFEVLPCENLFPCKLSKLTLSKTSLEWKHMSTLGKLKNLQVLKLKDYAFEGENWTTEDGGFKRLTFLHIGTSTLTNWNAKSSNFPALAHLSLSHCNKLEAIPYDFVNLSKLRMINIHYCKTTVATSAMKLQIQTPQGEKKFNINVYPPV